MPSSNPANQSFDLELTQELAVLGLAIVGAFLWLVVPVLQPFSLQIIAAATLLYFGIFFSRKGLFKQSWLQTDQFSLIYESGVISFILLLLIGSTGNTTSLLFPLSYAHLLLIAFTGKRATTILGTGAIILFHYLLTPTITAQVAVNLSSLPLMSFFFLFAKHQYFDLKIQLAKNAQQSELITQLESTELTVDAVLRSRVIPTLTWLATQVPSAWSESINQTISKTQEAANLLEANSTQTKND